MRKYIPIVYKPLVWYYLYKEQAQRISSNFAYKLELVIDTYGWNQIGLHYSFYAQNLICLLKAKHDTLLSTGILRKWTLQRNMCGLLYGVRRIKEKHGIQCTIQLHVTSHGVSWKTLFEEEDGHQS